MDAGCEGCGRRGHTAEQCKCKRHPNWNSQHATLKWKDCAVAQAIKVLANGEVRSLPRMVCNGFQQTESGSGESSLELGRTRYLPPTTNDPSNHLPPSATHPTTSEVSLFTLA